VAAFFAVLITTHLLDKYKRRGIFMLIGTSLSIVGYIMLISTGRPLIQYGGTFPVKAEIFPCSPIVMNWLANLCVLLRWDSRSGLRIVLLLLLLLLISQLMRRGWYYHL
jgi:hypothetical protein